MFKNIIFGLGVFAALFAMLIFSGRLPIGKGKSANTPIGEVMVWGTLPQNQVESLFQAVNATTKTFRISYQEIDEANFSTKLLETLASGRGPDLIIAPYQIILEQRTRLYSLPPQSISEQQYRDSYVDGASIFYNESGALALPVSVSPLVLFYNRTLFSNAGIINPPTKWDEFEDVVSKLTILDKNGRFIQNGISLGAYNNIPATKDIIMTLVSQLGQIPVFRNVSGTQEQLNVLADTPLSSNDSVRPLTSAARFFTQFADPNKKTYTWSPLLPTAQDQFLAEKLAMYIGYSDEASLMHAKNSRVDFGVKFLPQAKDHPTLVTGMKLYGIATLKRSSNLNGAFATQYLLSGTQYGPQLAQIANGFSTLKSVLSQTTSINEEYKKSILVARGWFDINQAKSNQIIQIMINDILSGRKNVSEAADAFVTTLSESYTR